MAFGYFNPNPVYRPQVLQVIAITQALQAEVDTFLDHHYLTGTVVRLYIPIEAGMQQLAGGEQWQIIVTGPTTFTIPVDSRFFDPFTAPPLDGPAQIPQVFPVGEDTFMLTMASTNIL